MGDYTTVSIPFVKKKLSNILPSLSLVLENERDNSVFINTRI